MLKGFMFTRMAVRKWELMFLCFVLLNTAFAFRANYFVLYPVIWVVTLVTWVWVASLNVNAYMAYNLGLSTWHRHCRYLRISLALVATALLAVDYLFTANPNEWWAVAAVWAGLAGSIVWPPRTMEKTISGEMETKANASGDTRQIVADPSVDTVLKKASLPYLVILGLTLVVMAVLGVLRLWDGPSWLESEEISGFYSGLTLAVMWVATFINSGSLRDFLVMGGSRKKWAHITSAVSAAYGVAIILCLYLAQLISGIPIPNYWVVGVVMALVIFLFNYFKNLPWNKASTIYLVAALIPALLSATGVISVSVLTALEIAVYLAVLLSLPWAARQSDPFKEGLVEKYLPKEYAEKRL